MKKQSYIDLVEFFVPPSKLTNEKLVHENPSWEVDKIYEKTGIKNRYIADDNITATDLAVEAGKFFLINILKKIRNRLFDILYTIS